jgi:8-oxo-dGTP pyrophosphatase MutT (NUDIX family)
MTKTIKTANMIKAAAIVFDERGRLLIVKKRGLDIWINLGGKCEQGETLEAALIREVQEEIGAEVIGEPQLYYTSPVEIATGSADLTVQIFAFLTKISKAPILNPEDSIIEFKWLSKSEYQKGEIKLASILGLYLIPKLIRDGLMK